MTEPAPETVYANLLRRTSQTGMVQGHHCLKGWAGYWLLFSGSVGGATYRGQQFSHDADFGRYSLGHVLQGRDD